MALAVFVAVAVAVAVAVWRCGCGCVAVWLCMRRYQEAHQQVLAKNQTLEAESAQLQQAVLSVTTQLQDLTTAHTDLGHQVRRMAEEAAQTQHALDEAHSQLSASKAEQSTSAKALQEASAENESLQILHAALSEEHQQVVADLEASLVRDVNSQPHHALWWLAD